MKLTMDMMETNVSVESRMVSDSISAPILELVPKWVKNYFQVSMALCKSTLTTSIKEYLVIKERGSDLFSDSDDKEFSYNNRYSSHLWKRHSALLVEAEKMNRYHEKTVVLSDPIKNIDSREERGSVSLYVKTVSNLPVWASNFDDIGVITRQL